MSEVEDRTIPSEGPDVLPLGLAGRILLHSWLLLLIGVVLGAGGGILLARNIPPTYSATATQLVKGIPGTGVAANYEAAQFAVSRARSYPSFIYSQEVLDGVGRDMGITDVNALRKSLTATAPTDTPLVQITATGRTAAEARDKANSAARHMASFITEIETVSGKTPISVETAVQALLPQEPSDPRPAMYAAIGASIGLVVAVIIAVGRYFAARGRPPRSPVRRIRRLFWRRSGRVTREPAHAAPDDALAEAVPVTVPGVSSATTSRRRGGRRRSPMASRRLPSRV